MRRRRLLVLGLVEQAVVDSEDLRPPRAAVEEAAQFHWRLRLGLLSV